uniref:Uncharacterized protein n=1 Tax=uncultured bacterium contig00032 TaxID=1181521 RepID=A0A806KMS4_9BACT|nr:hypothetical protein [uncultured bacterium contig00032]
MDVKDDKYFSREVVKESIRQRPYRVQITFFKEEEDELLG